MNKTKDIVASLPLLASVLGNKYGVEVHIGGDTACTDGKTIHIPALPLDCDAKIVMQIRAFLDHEAAHIRHTNFEALAKAQLNPTQKYLWNALEDWRVENALAKIFPGCKENFHKLIEEHFGKATQERAGKNPALSILSYVLLTVRAWNVASILTHQEQEGQIIEQHFQGLREKLDGILNLAKLSCHCTEDCIGYALALYDAIEKYAQNILETNKNKAPTKENAIVQEQLQKILQAKEEALPKHMGETLADTIQGNKGGQGYTLAVAIEGVKQSAAFSTDEQKEILRSSTALRTRLHGLLQATVQRPCSIGRQGKIHTAKLHRLASHNPRIFAKLGDKREISTAVHLLLDCSGSMDGSRMSLANKACYAVAKSLEQCRGVNVGVTAFPASTHNQTNVGIFPLVKHGQKVHPRFNVKARGCTPLTESLWWVMQQMHNLKENRKIILILSDGVPDSLYTAKHALTHAQKLGFEVLALGIEDNSLEMLLPNTSKTIHDLNMLPATLFGMLQRKLLQK